MRPRQHEDPGQGYLTAAAINLKRLGAALFAALSGIWTSRRHSEVRHRARPSSLQSFKQYAWPRSHELQIAHRATARPAHKPPSGLVHPASREWSGPGRTRDRYRPASRSTGPIRSGAVPGALRQRGWRRTTLACDATLPPWPGPRSRTRQATTPGPSHIRLAAFTHNPRLASRKPGLRQSRQDSDNGENTSPHETAAITRIPRSSSAADSPATNSRPHAQLGLGLRRGIALSRNRALHVTMLSPWPAHGTFRRRRRP